MPLAKSRGPRVGRPSGQFTQHKRLDKLKNLLEAKPRGVTLQEIGTVLKVTTRSARRYLRALDGTQEGEDFFTLEDQPTTPGGPLLWRLKPSERGRAVHIRRSQAYAILATRRALEALRGSALWDELDLALRQIEQIAETPFRTSGAEISGERDLEGRFFYVPPTMKSYAARGEDLDELFRAVADLRVLRWRMRVRAGEPRPERIVFLPYAMLLHRGAIVVLGARFGSPEDVEAVTFESMTDIRASETEHFELPASFQIDGWLHGELGIGPPTKARALIELDARVADELKTKKIHPLQKTWTAPDGRMRIQLPLVNVDALVAWILAFGDAAHVVEPPELVRAVWQAHERAAARYRS
ncbi:MAG TPA: WYL domain-containing protein [Labilithrix sp.]|jgi:predicted DNA-binding transcriptional regulator YafY